MALNVKDADRPASKRTKLSPLEDEAKSITQKADQYAYQSFDEFLRDIDTAARQAQDSLAPPPSESPPSQWKYQPDSLDFDRMTAQVKAFQKTVRTFVMQAEHGNVINTGFKSEKDPPSETTSSSEQGSSLAEEGPIDERGKSVLTLFGNAQGQHKQLFSSFQKPIATHFGTDNQQNLPIPAEALMSLRENGLLGNQIISTRLVPIESRDAVPASKQDVNFRNLFYPPLSLPTLTLPKRRSSSTNRSTDITWTAESAANEPSRKHGYTTEKLPAGQWLGYDSVSSEQEATSLEAKRRRRDRALSSSEVVKRPSEEVRDALAQAREDALFRRVYSSFAPAVDNSAAIIPEAVKNDLWYSRCESSYYDPEVAIDPSLEDDAIDGEITAPAEVDPDFFNDIVDNFEPADLVSEDGAPKVHQAQQTLHEMSELLELLLSHQRVRNSQLGANARAVPNPNMATLSGTAPNSAESAIYHELRSKLSALAIKLPPYALAKIGGDELADLTLSKAILLESRNYQGTMDDDQATRAAAVATSDIGAGTNSTARSSTTNRPTSYSNHGRTNSSQMTSGSSAATSRTTLSKPPLSNWQTPAQTFASQRSGLSQSSTYGRTPLNAFGNTNRPNGGGTGYPQTPSQPMYQQRAQNSTSQYVTYGQSQSVPRNPSNIQHQPGYPTLASRPPSTGYANATTSPGISQRPSTQSSAQSPLPQASPYAPPQTPSTPAISQTKQ